MKRIYWESGFEVWTLKPQSMFFFFCNFFLVVVPRNVKRPSSYFSTKGTWSFVATFSHAEPIGLAPPPFLQGFLGIPFKNPFDAFFWVHLHLIECHFFYSLLMGFYPILHDSSTYFYRSGSIEPWPLCIHIRPMI